MPSAPAALALTGEPRRCRASRIRQGQLHSSAVERAHEHPFAMLHPEQLDRDDIQAISRDGLIMALNRKVDLLTRNVAKAP